MWYVRVCMRVSRALLLHLCHLLFLLLRCQTKMRPGFAQERHEGATDADEFHDYLGKKGETADDGNNDPHNLLGKPKKGHHSSSTDVQVLTIHGTPRKPVNQPPELLLTTEVHAGIITTFVDDKAGLLLLCHEDVSLSVRALDVRWSFSSSGSGGAALVHSLPPCARRHWSPTTSHSRPPCAQRWRLTPHASTQRARTPASML